uniref:BPH_3 domain-containing protein n=1 Tax=Steinernema glaseri TaxID=37863 RepID=A0A1I7ZIQ2_9BILA
MVIDRDMMRPYLENEFNPRMRNISATEKPWLPAEKLIQEMKECLYFKYGSASDEDFKYDKNTGGTMVYYKVTCMRVKDSYYIGLSTYDNNFVLHDIEHVDVVQSGWSFLGVGKSKTKIERWFEKRYVTLNDLKQLLDFIMRDFAERIRMEYRQYLQAANIPVPE